MSIESEQDLMKLKRVGQVVRDRLEALKRAVKPDMTTDDLDVMIARDKPLLLTAD